jgi:hypothetical protein
MWHTVVWYDANNVMQEDRFTCRLAAKKLAAALAYYKIKAKIEHKRPAYRGPGVVRCVKV